MLQARSGTGGPLQVLGGTRNNAWGVSHSGPVGRAYSSGLLNLENRGGERLVLTRVRLLRRDKGIQLLGAYVVPRPPGAHIGLLPGFSSSKGPAPHGYVAHAHAQFDVVLGLRQTKTGMQAFRAVAIDYLLSGAPRELRVSFGVRLCAPSKTYAGNCPTPVNRH